MRWRRWARNGCLSVSDRHDDAGGTGAARRIFRLGRDGGGDDGEGIADAAVRDRLRVGYAVTVFLSNDATAVVLTPAVLAALKKARARPLSYLLLCAFIANAASFVLPISNPANLVVYGSKMPALAVWFRSFGLPSLVSIGVTFFVLRFCCRKELEGTIESRVEPVLLSTGGKLAAYGIGGAAIALMTCFGFRRRSRLADVAGGDRGNGPGGCSGPAGASRNLETYFVERDCHWSRDCSYWSRRWIRLACSR